MEEKYKWEIGQPLPILDQHSLLKHTIVEEYVRRYISTMMAPEHIPELKLTLVDGFSGGGAYLTEDGKWADGSPLLMMRAVREERMRLNLTRTITPRIVNAEYFFVDINPITTNHLKHILNAKLEERLIDLDDYRKSSVITGDFFKCLPSIAHRIHERKGGERALFVLDQYCYKDIPLREVKNILASFRASEVIMTFNVDNLVTWLSDRAENRRAVERIDLDSYIPWDELRHLKATRKSNRMWRTVLQKHLAYGIHCETGAKFITLFFVKPFGTNTWSYWLIHLANNYRAHDVMKSIHWQHRTKFGHELEPGFFILGYDANMDSVYTGIGDTFDFSEDNSKEECINGMMERFGEVIYQSDQSILLGDLFKNNIMNSPASESHLMEAIRRLHSMNDINIKSEIGKIKELSKKYKLTDTIEASKQVSIFGFYARTSEVTPSKPHPNEPPFDRNPPRKK